MSNRNAPSTGREVGRRPEFAIAPVPPNRALRAGKEPTPKESIWRRCCPCGRKNSESYEVADAEVEVPPVEITEEKDEGVEVISLDLLTGKHDVNKRSHHTEEFESEDLIVRRGQSFQIRLDFNRPFDPRTDKVILELQTGDNPQPAKGTHVTLAPVEQPEQPDGWSAGLPEGGAGRGLTLTLRSPPRCPVGRYRLSARTPGSAKPVEGTVYILFNPWCNRDSVYLDDEVLREEYVLNETGRIYYGTEKQIGARTWNFGQFSSGILEACLFLLDRSKMPSAGRGDAISVVRVISAMINSQDDQGVLMGNWSGRYEGGTCPTAWVGSVDILLEFHRSGQSVKYGQCWVFSGVVTTVLRCLGIPARSVTNFSSAHDTDVSLTNDIFLDEEMKRLEHMNYDSIWNFHVWNDCWMARPDLPPGFGGWQAIDATPQETSCGLYCCGPASLAAIRNGLVYLKYDAPFVFAEVNSDKVFWQRQADGTFRKVKVEKRAVGHKISTKAVGTEDREDITESYKFPEGTDEERIAVETACRHGSRPDTYADEWTASDVEVKVHTDDGIIMGNDFVVTIGLSNTGSECRSLTLYTQALVMYYTGVAKATFKRDKQDVLLVSREEKEVCLTLRSEEYLDFLVDQAAMMISVSGRVKETGQVIINQHTFRLRTPDLRIMPLGEAHIGKALKVEIVLTNPLPKALKSAVLRIEGPGLQKPRKVNVGDIPRQATITVTENLVPFRAGLRKLVASLDSQELTQVHGVTELLVQDD